MLPNVGQKEVGKPHVLNKGSDNEKRRFDRYFRRLTFLPGGTLLSVIAVGRCLRKSDTRLPTSVAPLGDVKCLTPKSDDSESDSAVNTDIKGVGGLISEPVFLESDDFRDRRMFAD